MESITSVFLIKKVPGLLIDSRVYASTCNVATEYIKKSSVSERLSVCEMKDLHEQLLL